MSINFALALALLNVTSMRAGRVLLALYALQLGAEPFTIGMLAATFSLFPAVLSWPAGKIADRFGSRWPLMIGALGGGAGMLVPYFAPGLTAIFVAAAMNGLSFSVYNVSLQNVVGLLSTPENRTRNFSNYSMSNSVANFIGPLLAGFAIQHLSHGAACLNLALLSLAPAALLAVWGGRLPAGRRRPEHAGGGVAEMLAAPGVRRTLATSSLLQTGQDLFQFYLPVYGHAVGLSPAAIGVVLAMNAAAAFVVRLILPRLIAALGEESVLRYAFYLSAASFTLLPLFKGPGALALIGFGFGLGMGCGQPIVTMLMFSKSAEGRSGEALGLRMTVNHLTRLLGPVLFGSIGSALGLAAVFWGNALMLGTGGLLSRTKPAASDGPDKD